MGSMARNKWRFFTLDLPTLVSSESSSQHTGNLYKEWCWLIIETEYHIESLTSFWTQYKQIKRFFVKYEAMMTSILNVLQMQSENFHHIDKKYRRNWLPDMARRRLKRVKKKISGNKSLKREGRGEVRGRVHTHLWPWWWWCGVLDTPSAKTPRGRWWTQPRPEARDETLVILLLLVTLATHKHISRQYIPGHQHSRRPLGQVCHPPCRAS